jgi:hypothetical protein
MKIFSKVACVGLLGAGLLPAAGAANAGAAQLLQFKFELNHPLVLSAESTTETKTERSVQLETGAKSAATTNSMVNRYKLRLTPVKKSADGVWTLHYEPFDFEEDLEASGSGGHVTTTIHGLEVRSTQNGIVVVDTSKGVGLAQAKAAKQGAYARMVSGNFDFQPVGTITKLEGDLPFVDYWTENIRYQVGFFDILFPTDAVSAGGSWTKVLDVKDLEGIKLGEAGIMETNTFTWQANPVATNHLIPITVTMAAEPKNIFGSMDSMGQNTALNISQFSHQKSGNYLFDPDAGFLNSGDETETLKMSMDMLVQGHTMTVSTELTIHSKFDLLPN